MDLLIFNSFNNRHVGIKKVYCLKGIYFTSQTHATCSCVKPKLGKGLCLGGGLYGGVVPDPGLP